MHLRSALLLIALAVNVSRSDIGVGSTKDDVIQAYGAPLGQLRKGAVETLLYPSGDIAIREGKVVSMPANFAGQQAEAQANKAKGQVLLDGKWVTPEEKQRVSAEESARRSAEKARVAAAEASSRAAVAKPGAAPAGGTVLVINNGGKTINLPSLLPKGKVTVVDFYADWCGPCKVIAPHLAALASQNPRVAVLKVNIVDWSTPVAKQFRLRSIPNLRVYDAQGLPVGSPTSSFHDAKALVDRALQ